MTMRTITLPAAGGLQTATLRRWLKNEGERVAPGELLLEAESDSGLLQIEAASGGVLTRIMAPAGQTVPAEAPLAEMEEGELGPNGAAPVPVGGSVLYTPTSASPSPSPQPSISKETQVQAAAPPTGSVTPILMPQAGQSMEEGTIAAWHVKPGDRIRKGQVIFDVETDKATVEVEAVDEGRLARIVLPQGGTLAVKQPVAYLAENDADADA